MDYDPKNPAHRIALAMDIKAILLGLGFTPLNILGVRELVMVKRSRRLSGVEMRVFTSIVGDGVREVGGDSIKVCTVFTARDGKTKGITKDRRVFRTGQIEEIPARIKERIKSAAEDLNEAPTCGCGAPKLKSKKGNMYCLDRCWEAQ